MGKKALQVKREILRAIRKVRLTEEEKSAMRQVVAYEGSPYHKRNPVDFGLTPPAAPRPDKTLCDEAGVFKVSAANDLLMKAIDRGLVSEATGIGALPKRLWVVDDTGQVFEAMYGGSRYGRYHGYPIRRSDPIFAVIAETWAFPNG